MNNNGYNSNGYNNGYPSSPDQYPPYNPNSQGGYQQSYNGYQQPYNNAQGGYQQPYNGYQQSYNPYQQNPAYGVPMQQTRARYGEGISLAEFSRKVYIWMSAGLSLTFIVGFGIMKFLTMDMLREFLVIYLIAAVAEVAMAFILGFFIYKLPTAVSKVLFITYSVLTGITIAPTLILCGVTTAFYAFAVTAAIFIGMSIYGTVTKRDLTSLGPLLLMGLLALIVFSVIALIFQMPMYDLITGIVGVVLFIGFTAYDTQKIRKGYAYFSSNPELLARAGINIALQLYLDFINLFLYIVRLFAANSRS